MCVVPGWKNIFFSSPFYFILFFSKIQIKNVVLFTPTSACAAADRRASESGGRSRYRVL
jgi:hypothetical protein